MIQWTGSRGAHFDSGSSSTAASASMSFASGRS
jgi:hypothetical protein